MSYFDNCYIKRLLFEYVKSFKFLKEGVVDTIAKKYNHIVLHLPLYSRIFNPID